MIGKRDTRYFSGNCGANCWLDLCQVRSCIVIEMALFYRKRQYLVADNELANSNNGDSRINVIPFEVKWGQTFFEFVLIFY